MVKENKTHQVYGPSAYKVACGRPVQSATKTALPGPGVTCKVCQKVEAARRREAKLRSDIMNECYGN